MSSCLATYLFVRPSTLGRPSFGFSDVPARRPIRRQPTSPSFRAAFSCVLFRGPNRTLPREAGHSPSPASRTASDRPIRLRSTSPSPRGAGWWTSRTRPCLRRARVFERVNPRVDPSEDSPPGDFPPSDPGDEATTPPRRAIPPSPRNPETNPEHRVKRSGCRGGGPCGIRGGSSIQTLRRKLSAARANPTKREPECPDATRGSRIPSCRPVDPGLGLSFELTERWTVVDRSIHVRFSHVGRVGDVYEAARRAKSEILRWNPKGVEGRAKQGKIAGR